MENKNFHKNYIVNLITGCWEWQRVISKSGYGKLFAGSRTDGSRKRISAHRYSYDIHNKVKAGSMYVCHSCDNKKCVNPAHLFLGTAKDNAHDMVKKGRGRYNYGENTHNSKLTNVEVSNIKYDIQQGLNKSQILSKYNLSVSIYKDIKAKRTWKSILPAPPNVNNK